MNLTSWLLVIDSIVVGACSAVGFNIVLFLSTSAEVSCFYPVPSINSSHMFITSTLQFIIFCILYPFTGWFADIKIGRKKTIHFSLWSCWLGVLLQIISYCLQFGLCGLPVNLAKYGISSVALLLIIIGSAGLFTNIPPCGLDQLYDKSNTHSRAFIHWTVWGIYVGYSTGYIAFVSKSIYEPNLLIGTAMVIFVMSSFALCLHSNFDHKFKFSETLVKNPYKMVYLVLKYAWQHKYPENRSALTYWENKIPNRINLGKCKYGGPFQEEDVEDTKTFWRIVIVILSTFGFFIVYYHTVLGVLSYTNSFKGSTDSLNGYGSYALWSLFNELTVIVVPILELVFIPLFPKTEYFLSKSLRGFGITYVLLSMSLIVMLTIDTVGHFKTQYEVGCSLSSIAPLVDMSYLYYIIPFIFSGIVGGLHTMFILEFICSQAPVNMSGMLTGMFWLVRAIYINIGAFLLIPFTNLDLNGPGSLNCSFWSLFTQFVICVIGLIVHLILSKWYKPRQREENYDTYNRRVLEDNYMRLFDGRIEMHDSNSSSEPFDIESSNSSKILSKITAF